MITKNEMVAVLAALTTDFDLATKRAAEDVRKAEERDRLSNPLFRPDSSVQRPRPPIR